MSFSTRDYLTSPETLHRQELEFGTIVREVVRRDASGLVCVSPLDVVLDAERALVLQPDVLYVSAARRHIVRDRVYGAPDLVIEVMSATTRRRDRRVKVGLYRTYGVGECWLVDADTKRVECVTFREPARRRIFRGRTAITSAVLGATGFCAADIFESADDWS
jgi:Uma2 family endonuclease